MKPIDLQLQNARNVLAPVAGANAALEARVLAGKAWGMSPEALVMAGKDARDQAALGRLLERRLKHEPVSQILGEKEFWKDTFIVSRDVLTPRADSETVIETLLRHRTDTNAVLRMLDLGTGSGCLLFSALREYPNALGMGVDRSAGALDIAQRNLEALQLEERAVLIKSDWFTDVMGTYDIVLSNPPYIPSADIAGLDADVRDFEPHGALDGGTDGLDCYRSILQQVKPFMKPQALLLFEVGAGQAEDVAALGVANGFTLIEISTDLAGIARVVALQTE